MPELAETQFHAGKLWEVIRGPGRDRTRSKGGNFMCRHTETGVANWQMTVTLLNTYSECFTGSATFRS
jgi:hypothetical protein